MFLTGARFRVSIKFRLEHKLVMITKKVCKILLKMDKIKKYIDRIMRKEL